MSLHIPISSTKGFADLAFFGAKRAVSMSNPSKYCPGISFGN